MGLTEDHGEVCRSSPGEAIAIHPRRAPEILIPLHLHAQYSSGTLRLKWPCVCATIRHRLHVTVPRKALMNLHL
jgi:hypothetical protein